MSLETPNPDASEALARTLRLLWPEATEIELAHESVGTRVRRRRPSRGRDLVVIPNATAPRLLVPLGHRAAASTAMRRFSTSLGRRAIAERLAVSAALRVGGDVLFADRFHVSIPDDDPFTEHLASVFGRPVTFSIGIGSARVNRKPVLQVFDERGRSLAYVKVAVGAESHVNVRSEADALERLADVDLPTIDLPQVMHRGEWNDLYVLAITALRTRARQPTNPGPPTEAMTELGHAFDEGSHALTDTEWWQRITACASEIQDPDHSARYVAAAHGVIELAGDRRWPIGAWHGDWTSWNMAWAAPRVQVWDWERFETGVPIGLDRYHYVVNHEVHARGRNLGPAIERGLYSAGATPSGQSSAEAAVYLLTVTSRYLPAMYRANGDSIAGRALATLEVLERWLDR